jgi:hypothetical protein
MNDICCEHLTIGTQLSELEVQKKYYCVENGITIKWMMREAAYWLSCYYESGHCRCDDRFDGENEYKTWVSETRKLKRLIEALKKLDNDVIVEW